MLEVIENTKRNRGGKKKGVCNNGMKLIRDTVISIFIAIDYGMSAGVPTVIDKSRSKAGWRL